VFHDRLALHDPIVSFFVVFSLLATVSAFEKNGSKTLAFSAGVLMGLAILTKVYAAVCLVWVFAVAIAMAPLRKEAALVRLALVYFAGMVLPVVPLVPVLASAILSENPTAAKFLSGSGITRGTVAANVSLIHSWFKYYTSVPFELYCVACSVAALIRPGKLKIAMLACFTVSITVFAVALKVLFARYLVVMLVPMVLLVAMVSAEGLGRIKTLFSVHERGTSPRRQRACASGTGATVESE
jgi:4-amino-4-deoxy-L-arabinose transferase-like glycosyltransferase